MMRLSPETMETLYSTPEITRNPHFNQDTMPWVLAAHRSIQSYPYNGCNAAHANGVYNREVPLADYIHAYCIYPCIHT